MLAEECLNCARQGEGGERGGDLWGWLERANGRKQGSRGGGRTVVKGGGIRGRGGGGVNSHPPTVPPQRANGSMAALRRGLRL